MSDYLRNVMEMRCYPAHLLGTEAGLFTPTLFLVFYLA